MLVVLTLGRLGSWAAAAQAGTLSGAAGVIALRYARVVALRNARVVALREAGVVALRHPRVVALSVHIGLTKIYFF
jgi:hypothetical protein